MQFTARLICPLGDPTRNKATTVDVGDESLGSAGVRLSLAQNLCSWEGFQIGGQVVYESLMSGIGPSFSDGTWSAEGYDFGSVANGDHYLARWTEKGDAKVVRGTWKLVMGTGSLEGITGEATFEEPAPKPGDTSLIATVTGWYVLPR